jgi:hypothetical protein
MKKFAVLLVLAAVMVLLVAVPARATDAGRDVYVVIMTADPAVAYEGGVAGLPATKPAPGKKITADSARVNRYEKYLRTKHDTALEAVGLSPYQKIHDYTISLNGFAVLLTKAQAEEIAKQPGVAMVLKDELREGVHGRGRRRRYHRHRHLAGAPELRRRRQLRAAGGVRGPALRVREHGLEPGRRALHDAQQQAARRAAGARHVPRADRGRPGRVRLGA